MKKEEYQNIWLFFKCPDFIKFTWATYIWKFSVRNKVAKLPNPTNLIVFKSRGCGEKGNLENQGYGFSWLTFSSWDLEVL